MAFHRCHSAHHRELNHDRPEDVATWVIPEADIRACEDEDQQQQRKRKRTQDESTEPTMHQSERTPPLSPIANGDGSDTQQKQRQQDRTVPNAPRKPTPPTDIAVPIGDQESYARVILNVPEMLFRVPGMANSNPSGHSYEFVLSKKLLAYLNETNPKLRRNPDGRTCRCMCLDMRTDWEDVCIIQKPMAMTRNRSERPAEGDATFLRYLLTGVPESLKENGRLFLRYHKMQSAFRKIERAIDMLAELDIVPSDPSKPLSLRHRSFSAWLDWVTEAHPSFITTTANAEAVQMLDALYMTTTTASGEIREVRSVWYAILADNGYTTGSLDPKNMPKASDNALPNVLLLHPKFLPKPAAGGPLASELRSDRAISFAVFFGMCMELHYLSAAKLSAIKGLWKKRMPLVSTLYTGGVSEPLVSIAKTMRREVKGHTKSESVASLTNGDIPLSPTDHTMSDPSDIVLDEERRRGVTGFGIS